MTILLGFVVELSCVSFVLLSIILFNVLQAFEKNKNKKKDFSYELTYGNSNEHIG